MNDKEKILQKIKKCLALSKSSNPHEAAIALKQAQALMQEYNVTQKDVMFSDVNKQASNSQATDKRPKWDHYLIWVVAQAFGCKTFGSYIEKGFTFHSVINFIGVGVSAELAAYTYNVLKRQLVKARGEYSKTTLKRIIRKNKIARADEFCMGWVHSVRKQVQDFANPQYEELLQEYLKTNHPDLVESDVIERKVTRGNVSADRFSGALAAQDVQLHHGVNGKNSLGLELKP